MTDIISRDEQLASVTWALDRMVELRKSGQDAWFRVVWATYSGRRVYRLEIRRPGGVIERPTWPLPVGSKNTVEETRPEGRDDGTALSAFVDLCRACGPVNVEARLVAITDGYCEGCGKKGASPELARFSREDAERAKR